jgi:transketolase
MGRDRFVLSGGHGSMFLYSLLHLSGYDLSLEELKNFRQLHSKTPGHPEYLEAPGVETTTGPLGQGIACATGMAIAQKLLAARFGQELFDAKVFALAGDGCFMEGISSEASSLAGHMRLNNLVLIYDSNDICLDGPTSECLTEDTGRRYEAYGFSVITIDGHDLGQIEKAFQKARAEQNKPTLIIARTIIGKGAPKKQGTNAAHGAKLGQEEIDGLKKALGWPDEAFHIPAEVTEYMASRQADFQAYETAWNAKLEAMKQADPAKAALWNVYLSKRLPADFADQVYNMDVAANKATRAQSQSILTKVAELAPFFISGSADLSCSDLTSIKSAANVTPQDWSGRNMKYGVREFAMAAISYGMALHGMIQPMCGTFFTFSDYMRNAIRIASLMKQRVIFQFTHDTILLGEDGPTHQPIEHLAALRAMPGVTVIRPADENELKAAWIEAFAINGPVALVLSRQNIVSQGDASKSKALRGVAQGAYVLYGEAGARCDVMLVATGSEVGLAMQAAKLIEAQGKSVRVVSMPSWELFEKQDEGYKALVLGGEIGLKVSIEAACEMGWHKWVGSDGVVIAINRFGISAPAEQLAEIFGFTPQKVADRVMAALPVSA